MDSRERRKVGHRRGMAAAIAVVLLATIHLVVIASVTSQPDDLQITALRIETARAFYASEAGTSVMLASRAHGLPLPAEGEVLGLGIAEVRFLSVPAAGSGNIEIEGRSGFARRRIRMITE